MKPKEVKHILKQELDIFFQGKKGDLYKGLSESETKAVNEIIEYGYTVIPRFLDDANCDKITNQIDSIIEDRIDEIWTDQVKSDHRIYGSNNLSEEINEFFTNQTIINISNAYLNSTNRKGFTLAAKLKTVENNPGSGGGWHRDTVVQRQIKSILYLTDVELGNGPFELLVASHRSRSIVKGVIREEFDANQTRFKDDEIQALIKNDRYKSKTLTAKKGSLVLVDTRGIHRGKPIEKGERYALTNYFWFDQDIPKHIEKMIIK